MPGRHRRPVAVATQPTSAAARLLLPVLAALVVVAVVVVPITWLAARLRDDLHPAAQGSAAPTGSPLGVAPGPTPILTTGSAPASASASPTPSSARPSPARPSRSAVTTSQQPAALATLRLWIIGDTSWVHVSAPGRLLAERRMVRGETASFAASQLFAILGNAGAVLVSVNGAPRRPAGPLGVAVRGTIHPA